MKRNAVIVFFCLACLLLGACSKESVPEAAQQTTAYAADTAYTISIDQLKTEPTFWDWNQNGTAMQVIALLDSAGKPRTIPVRFAWVRPTLILNIRTVFCTA